jgi:hypothetical protein
LSSQKKRVSFALVWPDMAWLPRRKRGKGGKGGKGRKRIQKMTKRTRDKEQVDEQCASRRGPWLASSVEWGWY